MDSYAFIWDMDGTLVDSYPAIVPAAQEACAAFGLFRSHETIHAEVIRTSVGAYIEQLAAEHGLDPAPIKALFNRLNDARIDQIRAMPHARETLRRLTEAGHACFVYTHRGESCLAILRQTGLLPYFTQVVTALDGFPRKPEPDAILYLMEKYDLPTERCYYVGDRSLDLEAAARAGIGSIFYLDPSSPLAAPGGETILVHDLIEIADRFCGPSA